jgi:hypothetical protein
MSTTMQLFTVDFMAGRIFTTVDFIQNKTGSLLTTTARFDTFIYTLIDMTVLNALAVI